MTSKGSRFLGDSYVAKTNCDRNPGSFTNYRKVSTTTGPTTTIASSEGLPSKDVFLFNQTEASDISFYMHVKEEKNIGQCECSLPVRDSDGVEGLVFFAGKRKAPKSLVVASGEELYNNSCYSKSSVSSTESQPLQSCRS